MKLRYLLQPILSTAVMMLTLDAAQASPCLDLVNNCNASAYLTATSGGTATKEYNPSLGFPLFEYSASGGAISTLSLIGRPELKVSINSSYNESAYGRLDYFWDVYGAPGAQVPVILTGIFELTTFASHSSGTSATARVKFAVRDSKSESPLSHVEGEVGSGTETSPRWGEGSLVQYQLSSYTGSDSYIDSNLGFDKFGDNASLRPSAESLNAFPVVKGTFGVRFIARPDTDGFETLRFIMQAFADGVGLSGKSASAMIDPYIEIDPDYLAIHPEARILVRNGIGNQPFANVPDPTGVPEPESLALFGLGLFALGLMRGKKQSS